MISMVIAVDLKKLADAEILRTSYESHGDESVSNSAKWSTMAEIVELEKLKLFDNADLLLAEKFVHGIF